MKIILINGSPNKNGTTFRALEEVSKTLNKEGIETETIQVGHLTIKGCNGCGACSSLKKCVYEDVVNEVLEKMQNADGLVVGSPVYFSSANGTLISFLDRLFSAQKGSFSYKIGASVVVARRAGTTATFDELNKYFLISNMIIPGSNYWNQVHGNSAIEAENDLEGLQTMRMLAKNIAYVLKSIKNANLDKPIVETKIRTNFTR